MPLHNHYIFKSILSRLSRHVDGPWWWGYSDYLSITTSKIRCSNIRHLGWSWQCNRLATDC
jgi:hypothetical protein